MLLDNLFSYLGYGGTAVSLALLVAAVSAPAIASVISPKPLLVRRRS